LDGVVEARAAGAAGRFAAEVAGGVPAPTGGTAAATIDAPQTTQKREPTLPAGAPHCVQRRDAAAFPSHAGQRCAFPSTRTPHPMQNGMIRLSLVLG
jgi:hypothetical protein